MPLPSPTSRHPKKTSRHDGRRWNLLATLQTVAARGSTSRADIARATGLTRATVSSLVAELIDEGFISELGPATTDSAGKPPTIVAINPRGRDIVAVDMSRRPMAATVVDLSGATHHRVEADDPKLEGQAALDRMLDLIAQSLEHTDAPVLGIGIGTPGMLDSDGRVLEADHLGWVDVPLRQIVAERFRLPVSVGNDAHVAALAEFRSHPAERDSLILVKIGEGIGAGVVMDGGLHTGDRYASGEIGHVVVDVDGGACRCGNRGCLETVAAVPAIIAAAAGRTETGLPWDALALAARFGEDAVRGAIQQAGRHLASVLASSTALLDATNIVVAFDLANGSDALVGTLGEELRRRLHPTSRRFVSVSVAGAASELVTAGAAAIVLRDHLGVVLR